MSVNMTTKNIELCEIFDNYEEFLQTFSDFCAHNYEPLIV